MTAQEPVDLAQFLQDASPLPRSEWQVPYGEHLVTENGVVSLWRSALDEAWIGDVRLAFCQHYLDIRKSLRTPFGEIELLPPWQRCAPWVSRCAPVRTGEIELCGDEVARHRRAPGAQRGR